MAADGIDDGEGGKISYGRLPSLVGYHLRRAQVADFGGFALAVTAVEGVSPGRFGMLQVIAANPGLSQSQLAEAMEVDRSAIVKVVDDFQRRGLIKRVALPRDRRRYSLQMTDAGLAALGRMEARVLSHEERLTQALSDDERRVLIHLLERLYSRRALNDETRNLEGRSE